MYLTLTVFRTNSINPAFRAEEGSCDVQGRGGKREKMDAGVLLGISHMMQTRGSIKFKRLVHTRLHGGGGGSCEKGGWYKQSGCRKNFCWATLVVSCSGWARLGLTEAPSIQDLAL